MELDGYCKDVCMAFEYQDKQHYEFIPYMHKNEDSLIGIQKRDKKKLDI